MSNKTKIKMEVCEIWNNLKDKTKIIEYLIDSKMQIAELQKQLEEKEKEIEKCNNAFVLDYSTREWRKIGEMQQENYQFKEAYKELRKQYNERVQENKQAHVLNDGLGERIKNLEQQLKSQPVEIVEKIKAYYKSPVYDRPEAHTKVSVLFSRLDTILKEYQKEEGVNKKND